MENLSNPAHKLKGLKFIDSFRFLLFSFIESNLYLTLQFPSSLISSVFVCLCSFIMWEWIRMVNAGLQGLWTEKCSKIQHLSFGIEVLNLVILFNRNSKSPKIFFYFFQIFTIIESFISCILLNFPVRFVIKRAGYCFRNYFLVLLY